MRAFIACFNVRETMRRLLTCLMAVAWLANATTALAVEFKISDNGSSAIRTAGRPNAPTPSASKVYSPPSNVRLAQGSTSRTALPSAQSVVDSVVGDAINVFESPVDSPANPPSTFSSPSQVTELPTTDSAVSIHETTPYEVEISDGAQFQPQYETFEAADGMPIMEGGTEFSTCDSCTAGCPSCTTGIDTSHVHWKAGDMFTADSCTSCDAGMPCNTCRGGMLGKFGWNCKLGGGCNSCTDGCTGGGCGCQGGGNKWFVDGWVSTGYTYNTEDPPSGFNTPLTFNDRDEEWMVNQVYLQFGRKVRESGCCWDWGGQIDLLYGSDYFFTQSIGLETRRDGSPHWNSSDGPRSTGASLYGLAMPQAYLEFYSPWLNGINVKLGHFYTTIGYESVMAPQNFFYSHAYTMQYGEPFTHTGILTSFGITNKLTGHFGITRGWDTWEDPNGSAGYLAGLSFAPSDVSSLAFTMHTGREDDPAVNNRFVYSLVYTRELGQHITYVLQHDGGNESNAEIDVNGQPDSASWYGINQYLFVDLTSNITAGIRAEWFRDQDNARVLAIPQESLVDGSNYGAVSLGLNIRGGNNFVFRPEARFDWSDVVATGLAGNGMFNDFRDRNQITLAGDLIFQF